MTLGGRLGRPVEDREQWLPQQTSECGVSPPPEELTLPADPKRHIWPIVVVAVFAIGALTGWLASGMAAPGSPAPGPAPSVPPGIAGTAELFTSLYLTGTSGDAIAQVFAGEPPAPSEAWVNHTAAVAVDQVGANRWNVMVAVDSLELRDGRFDAVPLAFYRIPVALAGSQAIVVGAPARVPAPARADPTAGSLRPVPEDQAAVSMRFIELHLTGAAEARQLLANPRAVAPFSAPPYVSARAETVGVDSLGRVVVAVQATTARDATHRLEYLVTLEASESGWRVAAIGAATR